MPESLIVVVDNPPFLASTQVKNVPHLGHLCPMTSSNELIAGSENSEHNCSCALLFLRVGKDKMFGDRIMERAHLLNGRVDSVKDDRVRIPTQVGSFASSRTACQFSNCEIHTNVVPEKHVTPCGTKTFIITSLSWSLLTGRCKVPMERCKAACRSIRTRSLKKVSMCT